MMNRALKQIDQMPKGELLPFVQSEMLWVAKPRNEKKRLADKQRSIIYTWNDISSASPLHSNGREEWNVGPGSPKDLSRSHLHKKRSQMYNVNDITRQNADWETRNPGSILCLLRTGTVFGTEVSGDPAVPSVTPNSVGLNLKIHCVTDSWCIVLSIVF